MAGPAKSRGNRPAALVEGNKFSHLITGAVKVEASRGTPSELTCAGSETLANLGMDAKAFDPEAIGATLLKVSGTSDESQT